ncbi:hypothetical protein L1049_012086 [Liquidambar formosana]|uniref:Uncharacterized protein n=1 Tax=Liquidambar formosana TaxID=63359 RepID=A0AAP0RYG3_LIQFO
MVLSWNIFSGHQKKRKRVGGVNSVLKRQQVNSSFGCASPSSFVSCIGCSARSYTRPFSRHCRKKCSQMTLFEAVMPRTGEVCAFSKGNPDGELQQCSNQIDPIEELQQSSNQITAKPRKRARQFSWQRHRKCRQLNFQEANFLTPCVRIHTDKGSLSGGLQGGSNTS